MYLYLETINIEIDKIEKVGIDVLHWWNNKVESEDDKETQKLIENARRDLLTAPNLIIESKIQSDGSKVCVLNGRVRSCSKTFNAAKTKIDLNGRVNRVRKKQINILVNDDTSMQSLLNSTRPATTLSCGSVMAPVTPISKRRSSRA